MKVAVCFLAICVAAAYCSVKDNTYNQVNVYGSEKEYGKEKKYDYEVKDKSHGYDDDEHKRAYGSEKEYGKEREYGHASHDKSYSYDGYTHGGYAHGGYAHGDYAHGGYAHGGGYKDEYAYGGRGNNPEAGRSYDDGKHGVAYNKQYIYHGKFAGHCGKDGFYYRDHGSFVICSNNNAYVQPCAPGSRNSGLDSYNYGTNYNYRDFCDINLVDHGYGVEEGHPFKSNEHHNSHGYRGY